MQIESKVFKSRFMRSLEVSRLPILKIDQTQISSTPIVFDSQRLILNSPLFPFAFQIHGEIQGYCFFTANNSKIPFSQNELRLLLKKYFHFFTERIENHTNLLISLSEVQTPKYERIPKLMTPMYKDINSMNMKQTLHIRKNNNESLDIICLYSMIASKTAPLDI